MKKLFFLFLFVMLATVAAIPQTSAQIIKLEPLTAHGCGRQYVLQDSQDLKKVFGSKWKLLFKVNPELQKRILFGGSVLQKLYSNDTLCVPSGLKVLKEKIPADAVTPESIRPDQIFSSETKTSVPATTPISSPRPTPIMANTSDNEDEVLINLYYWSLGLIVAGLVFFFGAVLFTSLGNRRREGRRAGIAIHKGEGVPTTAGGYNNEHQDHDPFSGIL